MAGKLLTALSRDQFTVRRLDDDRWLAVENCEGDAERTVTNETDIGQRRHVFAATLRDAKRLIAQDIAVVAARAAYARGNRAAIREDMLPLHCVEPLFDMGSRAKVPGAYLVTIFGVAEDRWDLKKWDEATESKFGLAWEALPLWQAGKDGLGLERAMELAVWCKSEPSLRTRLAKVAELIDAERPKIGRGDEHQNRLKVATLLFLELYEPVSARSKKYRQRPGISVSEATRRVKNSGHPASRPYVWESIANLHKNHALMREAAVNSSIWKGKI